MWSLYILLVFHICWSSKCEASEFWSIKGSSIDLADTSSKLYLEIHDSSREWINGVLGCAFLRQGCISFRTVVAPSELLTLRLCRLSQGFLPMHPCSLHTVPEAASLGMRCRIEGDPSSSTSSILGSKGVLCWHSIWVSLSVRRVETRRCVALWAWDLVRVYFLGLRIQFLPRQDIII